MSTQAQKHLEILNRPDVNFNLSLPGLMEIAIKKEEGRLTPKRLTPGYYR